MIPIITAKALSIPFAIILAFMWLSWFIKSGKYRNKTMKNHSPLNFIQVELTPLLADHRQVVLRRRLIHK